MSAELVIRFADLDDIPMIGYLAQQIWPETYGSILTPDQLAYMLDYIYSPASLTRQMSTDQHRFVIVELDEEPVGFASWGAIEPGVFKLHKLYVHQKTQGKGIGKALMDFVIEQVREEDPSATALRLNVNRYNKAKFFYEKLGFAVIREEDVDIGNNYFMIDFVMEKKLDPLP